MAQSGRLGKEGEQAACDFLISKGYVVRETNWRLGHLEIDIIAQETGANRLHIVEVKTRRNRLFSEPEQSVDYRKMRNLLAASNHYVKLRHLNNPLRFDIITIVGAMGQEPEVSHLEDIRLL